MKSHYTTNPKAMLPGDPILIHAPTLSPIKDLVAIRGIPPTPSNGLNTTNTSIRWHPHIVINRSAKGSKAHASNSSSLWSGFCAKYAACDAASSDTVLKIVLASKLFGTLSQNTSIPKVYFVDVPLRCSTLCRRTSLLSTQSFLLNCTILTPYL